MRSLRSSLVGAGAVVAACVLLAACGSSEEPDAAVASGEPSVSVAGEGTDPSLMPSTAPEGEPLPGGAPMTEAPEVLPSTLDMDSPALAGPPSEAPGMPDGTKTPAMPTETIPAETMPVETTMPAETMPAETMPAETMPAETMPAEVPPGDETGLGGQDTTVAEPQPAGPVTVDAFTVTSDRVPVLTFAPGGTGPDGLLVKKILQGSGPAVTSPSDVVTVNYVGKALSTGAEFDSSFTRGEPAQFALNQVIPGWTEGLAGARVGDRVLLVVPADKGYGEQGVPGIAGGETLVFVVDVLAVAPAAR